MCCACVRERCALGAALLYELLYIRVFGVEEAELSLASEAFRLGGRRYRNSLSMCSDMDGGYEMPETHRYGTARDAQLESDWSVNVYTAKKKKKIHVCARRPQGRVGSGRRHRGGQTSRRHRRCEGERPGDVITGCCFFYYIFIFTLKCQRMRRH